MTDDKQNSPAWQRYRAVRTLACHARDAEELAEVLETLGLTAEEGRVAPVAELVPRPRTPVKLDDHSACRLGDQLREVYATNHEHAR